VLRGLIDALGEGCGHRILVGASGGTDSSALLLLLSDLRDRSGWAPIAAHVDHGIVEASVRAQFRAKAAEAASLADAPLELAAVDADAEARAHGGGIEAAARRLRYRALWEIACRVGANAVATAHTRDDQAETILLHLVRGSGLDGLAGMPPLGPMPEIGSAEAVSSGPRLVRPLLGTTRAETEVVCAAWGFAPAEDPSNADLERTRNRLRREVLPLLREINPAIDAALSRLSDGVRADLEWIAEAAATVERSLGRVDVATGAVEYERSALLALHPALRARVLRLAAERLGPPLSAERSRAALALASSQSGVVELGGGRVLQLRRGRLRLSLESGPLETEPGVSEDAERGAGANVEC